MNYVEDYLLQSGQQIVWKGRPSAASAAKLGLRGIFDGALAMVFGAFWILKTSWPEPHENEGSFQLLHMIGNVTNLGFVDVILFTTFSVAGFWLFVRPVRYYLRATRTEYVVTEHNVFLFTDWWWRRVVRISPSDISDYELREFGGGAGDIRLRRTGLSGYWTPRSVRFRDGLWGICDVEGADEAITAILAP